MRRFYKWKGTGFGLVLCLFVGACKVGPHYATPSATVANQWSQPGKTVTAESVTETNWWRQFKDPVLDALVMAARQNNPSLQIAGVRVLEARAHLNKTIGNLFPQQQTLSAGVNYSRLNDGMLTRLPGISQNYFSDQILFAASWETDLWGKYRRSIESDRATYLGALATWEDALVTLTADVAATYVNLRTAEERREVARKNVELETESLRIAAAQFKAGETSELDVQQAKAQLARTEAAVPVLEEAVSQARNGLALLLGETVDQVQQRVGAAGMIPVCPETVAAGLPHDLLRRRPDIRAAGFAAASKSALIGVARANMYPSLSLAGEFGFTGSNEGNRSLTDMFCWEGRALNAGAGLVFPIFNYGRLLNQVRVQDAQFQEAILNYQNTVLQAQQEVENGIAAFVNQRQSAVLLTNAVTAAQRSTDLALVQYKGGQTDYTTVLAAEQGQLSVEDSLTTTRGNVVLGLISIYRALGGGWEWGAEDDVVSAEVKAEMARRTDWGKLLEPAHHLPRERLVPASAPVDATPN